MTKGAPIVGKFETHTYVPWYWWPANMLRQLAGRPQMERTVVTFRPKQPIVVEHGEAIELRFYEDGTVEAFGTEAKNE